MTDCRDSKEAVALIFLQSLQSFLFFSFLFYYLFLKPSINITESSALYLYTAVRGLHIVKSLWLSPSGVKNLSRLFY